MTKTLKQLTHSHTDVLNINGWTQQFGFNTWLLSLCCGIVANIVTTH